MSCDGNCKCKQEKEYKIITLCGSTKYKDLFNYWNRKLTNDGHCVFSVSCFGHADKLNLGVAEKTMLDIVHKRKIDNSDAIFVINKDGYIGSSTLSEIEYAKKMNKLIIYMENQ